MKNLIKDLTIIALISALIGCGYMAFQHYTTPQVDSVQVQSFCVGIPTAGGQCVGIGGQSENHKHRPKHHHGHDQVDNQHVDSTEEDNN